MQEQKYTRRESCGWQQEARYIPQYNILYIQKKKRTVEWKRNKHHRIQNKSKGKNNLKLV